MSTHRSTLRLNTATKRSHVSDAPTRHDCLRDVVTRNATFVAVDET